MREILRCALDDMKERWFVLLDGSATTQQVVTRA
jgi:hypothetical protein